MQSRKASSIETFVNNTSGYMLAIGIQLLVFPFFDIHIDVLDSAILAAFFTSISMIRGYIVRRIFNWLNVTGRLV